MTFDNKYQDIYNNADTSLKKYRNSAIGTGWLAGWRAGWRASWLERAQAVDFSVFDRCISVFIFGLYLFHMLIHIYVFLLFFSFFLDLARYICIRTCLAKEKVLLMTFEHKY